MGQVKAMEERAAKLGMAKKLYYMFPNNHGPKGEDSVMAASLGLGDHLVVDIHDGAMGGVSQAERVFSTNTTATWGAINLETNCGDHTVKRMLEEAQDLNMFFAYPNQRLKGRAGSFCMERSGYNEAGLNDQGISFFLPNMTWLQPPGYVHAMISDTWQPLNVNYSATPLCGSSKNGMISAQVSEDGMTVVVRFVNYASVAMNITIDAGRSATVRVSTMAFPDLKAANTPAEPMKVSPTSLPPSNGPVEVAGYSYTIFVAKMHTVAFFI